MPIPAGFVQHMSGFWMRTSDQAGPFSSDGTNMTLVTVAAVAGAAGYPAGATPLTNSSGNVANATAVATLAGAAGLTTYITGFQITGTGATAAAAVTATLAGIIGGTASYTIAAMAGAVLANNSLLVDFSYPIPASAVNTAIVLTLPALGIGNTNSTVTARGYRV